MKQIFCNSQLINQTVINYNNVGYVFKIGSDLEEISIGYKDKISICLNRKVVNKFIFWYLYYVVMSEWFGLKKKLCNILLRKKMNINLKGF